jgi:hypothetical protein
MLRSFFLNVLRLGRWAVFVPLLYSLRSGWGRRRVANWAVRSPLLRSAGLGGILSGPLAVPVALALGYALDRLYNSLGGRAPAPPQRQEAEQMLGQRR